MEPSIVAPLVVVGVLAFLLGRRLAVRPGPSAAPHSPPRPAPSEPPEAESARCGARVNFEGLHPALLLENADFREGVVALAGAGLPRTRLAALADSRGNDPALACMALELLRSGPADEAVGTPMLSEVGRVRIELLYFYLRALPVLLPGRPLAGDVLFEIARHWSSEAIGANAMLAEMLNEFVAARIASGERPSVDAHVAQLNELIATDLLKLVERTRVEGLEPVAEATQRWFFTRIDQVFLRGIGRIWDDAAARAALEPVVMHASMEPEVTEILRTLGADPPRSVLLIGEAGVGKSVLAKVALARLRAEGFTVLEAGSAELQAGQIYIGQIEERLTQLVRELDSRRRILWYVPDFANLAWVGRHQQNPTSALDHLLPHIERGAIVVLGESQPGAFEQLTRTAPGCATALRCVRMSPLDETTTLDLARRRLAHEGIDERLLREAWQLAEQYLRDRAAPGNLLRLLDAAVERRVREARQGPLGLDDLILTLGGLTGLPGSILDDRLTIDLEALRRFFERRVMGQPEAVDCLIERVAMIKAGVTDPTRPSGVFLFAGPTGTGKTEIAKALAAYLFGSEQRMIRLDMSELQTPEALSRVVGESGSHLAGDRALTESIRKQPFSVVLLDEFEKAHPQVWDLFLQVFDDGRLTDRRGVVADFRHAIIILTSNLGAVIPTGASLGFGGADGAFRAETVMREIGRSFRREFVNRLDRIVVFRPLARETMRDILRREIGKALERRGLRNRAWAVEWEPPALEFLLEQGFTADLGARPLRRAVERYFLAPLARTIVNREVPRGDQFLFVRTDGKQLEVVFVDPDAPPDVGEPQLDVAEALVAPPEVAALAEKLVAIAGRVEDDAWRERKRSLMTALSERGFWDSERRFAVLGEIEYLDRIESGLETCRSLFERLDPRPGRPRRSVPRDLVARLAQQLHLLEAACDDVIEGRPRDVFVEVDAGFGTGGSAEQRDAFARRVGRMYREWARKRGMQLEVLEECGGDGRQPYRLVVAVSGFAPHSLLLPEEGLHVHEIPDGDGAHNFRRCAIHVRVAPQPDEPPASRAQAAQALAGRGRDGLGIVRRYRDLPSPLVRDDVRRFRTGRLDLVLGGDFDLIGGAA